MAEHRTSHDEDDLFWTEDDEDSKGNKHLLFRIGAEIYGLPIAWVTSIEEMQKITEVPDMPAYIKGVINLRGKIIPVMSVRMRFKLEDRAYDDRTCIIVMHIDGLSLGLIVDTVAEVLDIPVTQVELPPTFRSHEKEHYIAGLAKVGEDVKILLDAQKMMHREDLSIAHANAAPAAALATA